jgi:hypothetical protein
LTLSNTTDETDPFCDDTFHHTPSKPPADFDAAIDKFLNECRPRMRQLVKNAKKISSLLPPWNPGSLNKDLEKRILQLQIPTVSSGGPSLLLHDLGEEKSSLDTERIARIPDVFSFAKHTWVT